VVLVVPLLFEAGMTDLVTEIWVVRCSRQQLERLMQRDQLTEEVAQARLTANCRLKKKQLVRRSSRQFLHTEALLKQVDAAVTPDPS